MTIDWNGKLEAVHTDGTVMAVEVAANTHDPDDRQPIKVWPAPSDLAFWFALDGSHPEETWRIRNVVPPTHTYTVRPEDEAALLASDPLSRSTPDERAVDIVLYERMTELTKRIANPGSVDHNKPGYVSCIDEARAIVAALEPVDGDLVIAREICVEQSIATEHYDDQLSKDLANAFRRGSYDEGREMRIALNSIKRGRQLEKEGK